MIRARLIRPISRTLAGYSLNEGEVTPPDPVWNGAPKTRVMALLGDSIAANNTSLVTGSTVTEAFENYGFNSHALRAANQALIMAHARNFGVGGDTSTMAEARVQAAIDSGAKLVTINLGTNDRGSANMTADETMVVLTRIRKTFMDARVTTVFLTPHPRGNPTYPDKTLSATQSAYHKTVHDRMLAEFPADYCFVVDTWPALLRAGTTLNEIIDGVTSDGLHPNTRGAHIIGLLLAQVYANIPASSNMMAATNNDGWTSTNPTGYASYNPEMLGTGGTPGTGGSGQLADNYSGSNATGLTGVTRTYSKVAKNNVTWQQVVVGGAVPTAAAALDIVRQISLQTRITPGLVYEGVGYFEIDAGMANILSLQLGVAITTSAGTSTYWESDRYQEGSFMPSEADSGVMRTPRFVMPDGVTDVRLRLTCYMSTAGAPAATIRTRGLCLQPVQVGEDDLNISNL